MLCQKLKKQLSLIGWKNIIAGITIVSAFGTVGYYCYSKQKNKRLEQQSFIENQEQSISASLLFENSKFMNDNNILSDMNTKEADQNSMQGISANESTTKENNYISSNEQPSTNENGNSTPEINHPNVQIEDSIQFTIPENIEFDRVYTIKVISKRYKDEKEESTTLNFKVVEYDYDAVKCVIFYQSGQRE